MFFFLPWCCKILRYEIASFRFVCFLVKKPVSILVQWLMEVGVACACLLIPWQVYASGVIVFGSAISSSQFSVALQDVMVPELGPAADIHISVPGARRSAY